MYSFAVCYRNSIVDRGDRIAAKEAMYEIGSRSGHATDQPCVWEWYYIRNTKHLYNVYQLSNLS